MHKVVLGITGGIAAYKSAELARLFVRSGVEVQVIMTASATEFISSLTMQTLTERPAFVEMYSPRTGEKIRHINLLDGADLFVIAPASANTIAKMASGLADNLLTTTYLAADCPVVVVPSMNVNMFKHPTLKENISRLRSHGCLIMDPASGELACGVYGSGRMPEPDDIYAFCRKALTKKDYHAMKALVTAGPTREPLDPVRYLSNPATGKMGYALAGALEQRGAAVTLISGPTHLNPPPGVKLVPVVTAGEMHAAVFENYEENKLIIKAAAVSDFRPLLTRDHKVKKKSASLSLELALNPDILYELGERKGDRVLVGFAAETEAAVENARDKLLHKNLDLIIVNNLNEPGAGFAVQTNKVMIIDRQGQVQDLPLMDKEQLAHRILDRVAALLPA